MSNHLQDSLQEENQSLKEENNILRTNISRLHSIVFGNNQHLVLTGNMQLEMQNLSKTLENQRKLIEKLEGQLEDSSSRYESTLESSLSKIKSAKTPKKSYLQEVVEREEARVEQLRNLLKQKLSTTARELTQLQCTQIEQSAELSLRSTQSRSKNSRSKYLRPL